MSEKVELKNQIILAVEMYKESLKEDGKRYSLNFTTSSIMELEKHILKDFIRKNKRPLDSTILCFGYYLGEVVLRNIKGAEVQYCDKNNAFDYTIKINEFSVRPCYTILNYIESNGKRDLSGWFGMVKKNATMTAEEFVSNLNKSKDIGDGFKAFDIGNGKFARVRVHKTEE